MVYLVTSGGGGLYVHVGGVEGGDIHKTADTSLLLFHCMEIQLCVWLGDMKR